MNKNDLLDNLTKNLKRNCQVNKLIYGGQKTPLFEVINKNKKVYFIIFEAGVKKDVKDPTVIWHRINKEILDIIDFDNTFVIIIDFKPFDLIKPKFVLAKLNKTNYFSHGNDSSFHFYRQDYGGFFNTSDFEDLIKKISLEYKDGNK